MGDRTASRAPVRCTNGCFRGSFVLVQTNMMLCVVAFLVVIPLVLVACATRRPDQRAIARVEVTVFARAASHRSGRTTGSGHAPTSCSWGARRRCRTLGHRSLVRCDVDLGRPRGSGVRHGFRIALRLDHPERRVVVGVDQLLRDPRRSRGRACRRRVALREAPSELSSGMLGWSLGKPAPTWLGGAQSSCLSASSSPSSPSSVRSSCLMRSRAPTGRRRALLGGRSLCSPSPRSPSVCGAQLCPRQPGRQPETTSTRATQAVCSRPRPSQSSPWQRSQDPRRHRWPGWRRASDGGGVTA